MSLYEWIGKIFTCIAAFSVGAVALYAGLNFLFKTFKIGKLLMEYLIHRKEFEWWIREQRHPPVVSHAQIEKELDHDDLKI